MRRLRRTSSLLKSQVRGPRGFASVTSRQRDVQPDPQQRFVSDLGLVVEHPVLNVDAGRDELLTRGTVADVPDTFFLGRVSQDDADFCFVGEKEIDKLSVLELVEADQESTILGQILPQHGQDIAGQVFPDAVIRIRNHVDQLIGLFDAIFEQNGAKPLRCENTVRERRLEFSALSRDVYRIGGNRRAKIAKRTRFAFIGFGGDLFDCACCVF
jgi:hypothetical protein